MGSEKSTPILPQLIHIDWYSFEVYIQRQKAKLCSRIIRSPDTNILYQVIKNKYWYKWLNVRYDWIDDNNYNDENFLFELHGNKLLDLDCIDVMTENRAILFLQDDWINHEVI